MTLPLEEKTRICTLAADERKAHNIVVLDVHAVSSIADRFVICSGTSDRQVQAIADAITEALTDTKDKPLATEGYQQGTWVLMDCGDIIVHIFDEGTRHFYNLEHLWHQAPRVEVAGLPPSTTPTLSAHSLFVEEDELM